MALDDVADAGKLIKRIFENKGQFSHHPLPSK